MSDFLVRLMPAARRATGSLAVSLLLLASSAVAADVQWTSKTAVPDAAAPAPQLPVAFVLGGIASDFVFVPDGQFEERSDGTATLTGVIESAAQPGLRFGIHLALAGLLGPGDPAHPPLGSPKKDLLAAAYAENGGPIDPATWRYYPDGHGLLVGLADLQGARVAFQLHGAPFQVGVGASGRNVNLGASGWFAGQTVSQPTVGPALPPFVNGDGSFDLDLDQRPCAESAPADPSVGGVGNAHAFIFVGLGEFVFATPGTWNERPDGTATLMGTIVSAVLPNHAFDVVMELSNRLDLGDAGYPPFGSPKKDLVPAAYVEGGGSIDTATWRYYTTIVGTLVGRGKLAGAELSMVRVGPALQVGFGASGKNLVMGASSWLELTTLKQPRRGSQLPATFGGDMNVDLDAECDLCVRPSAPDLFGAGNANAFILPGIGMDFDLVSPASFVERSDGTASIDGVLVRASAPQERFHLTLELWGRVDPGDPTFPPPGSPKQLLSPSAYAENGGPADTATWRYYQVARGELTGVGAFVGALLELRETGPAFQVGVGANGKNVQYGASGWFVVQTISSPDAGPVFPAQFVGDGNFDLGGDCPPFGRVAESVVAGAGCAGAGNFVPQLRLLGAPSGLQTVVLRVRDGLGGAAGLLLLGESGANLFNPPCVFHVDQRSLVLPFVFRDAAGVPGAGSFEAVFAVPPVAATVNVALQAVVKDPAGFGGFALSNGLSVMITP